MSLDLCCIWSVHRFVILIYLHTPFLLLHTSCHAAVTTVLNIMQLHHVNWFKSSHVVMWKMFYVIQHNLLQDLGLSHPYTLIFFHLSDLEWTIQIMLSPHRIFECIILLIHLISQLHLFWFKNHWSWWKWMMNIHVVRCMMWLKKFLNSINNNPTDQAQSKNQFSDSVQVLLRSINTPDLLNEWFVIK